MIYFFIFFAVSRWLCLGRALDQHLWASTCSPQTAIVFFKGLWCRVALLMHPGPQSARLRPGKGRVIESLINRIYLAAFFHPLCHSCDMLGHTICVLVKKKSQYTVHLVHILSSTTTSLSYFCYSILNYHSLCHWLSCSFYMWMSRSTKLAKLLGCPTSDPAYLEVCLQKAQPEKITAKQYDVLMQPSVLGLPFVPVVDGDFLREKVEVGLCRCH